MHQDDYRHCIRKLPPDLNAVQIPNPAALMTIRFASPILIGNLGNANRPVSEYRDLNQSDKRYQFASNGHSPNANALGHALSRPHTLIWRAAAATPRALLLRNRCRKKRQREICRLPTIARNHRYILSFRIRLSRASVHAWGLGLHACSCVSSC